MIAVATAVGHHQKLSLDHPIMSRDHASKRHIVFSESRVKDKGIVTPDKRSAWLQKLDQECPYQITLPRRQLTDDTAIMDFLLSSYVGKFDMYVEDECAAYVRYCFADPMDAAIFRSRFEPKASHLGSPVERLGARGRGLAASHSIWPSLNVDAILQLID